MFRVSFTLTILVVALAVTAISAGYPGDISYQGRLLGNDQNPMPDQSYDIMFSIWDDSTGGTQLWSQLKSVQTTGGLFSAVLQNPFAFLFPEGGQPPDDGYFLQLQVGTDPPVMPRTRLTSSFGAALTRRVSGDFYSSAGKVLVLPDGAGPPEPIFPPEPIQPSVAIQANSAGLATGIGIYGAVPPDDSRPQLMLQADSGSADFWLGETDESGSGATLPVISMHTNAVAQFNLGYAGSVPPDDTQPPPDNTKPGLSLMADETGSMVNLVGSIPPDDTQPGVALSADGIQSAVSVFGVIPPDDGKPSASMTASSTIGAMNIVGVIPPDDSKPQINAIAKADGTDFWLGSTDVSGAGESLPVISMQTGTSAHLNFGFATGQPPDDNSPAPDNTMPGITVDASAGRTSFTLHGPDDGAGDVKQIVMTADDSEAFVGINTDAPTSALYVDGDIVATGAITEISDMRLKKNVENIDDAIELIEQIRGVTFQWRQDQDETKTLPKGKRVGLIAQDVERVLPEAVVSPEDGYKSVDYSRLTPILVEAIKDIRAEKDAEIDALQKQISELKELVLRLTSQPERTGSLHGVK